MTHGIKQSANGANEFISTEPFTFKNGGQISELRLIYETYGELNANRSNAILIHHALSTGSHISSHDKNTAKGWWENMVGPKRPIDTNKFYVICINNLGSCFGSSGPITTNQATNKPYQADFPQLTVEDMVHSQNLLISF